MRRSSVNLLGYLLSAVLVGFTPDVMAADDDASSPEVLGKEATGNEPEPNAPRKILARVRERLENLTPGEYFIGIHASPIDDALKSHLNIQSGLLVEQVIPESPAAKAGIEVHDVLLKFGETDLKNVTSLLEAVEKNKDQQTHIKWLRKASEQSGSITPAERPENLAIAPEALNEERVLKFFSDEKGPAYRLQLVNPGVHMGGKTRIEERQFPEGLSVQILKEGKERAKITVKHQDKTWAFSEDNKEELGKLPAEIREQVADFIHRGPMHFQVMTGKRGMPGMGAISVFPGGHGHPSHALGITAHGQEGSKDAMEHARKQIEDAMKRIPKEQAPQIREQLERALAEMRKSADRPQPEEGSLQELKDELKQLREAVDDLKKHVKREDKQ